jgi:FAD/FMN-containing dehydrogenase
MVVQCGVDWMEINSTLKEKGIPLFFPVSVPYVALRHDQQQYEQLDPGPAATIGGMLSTGCSGSRFSLLFRRQLSHTSKQTPFATVLRRESGF